MFGGDVDLYGVSWSCGRVPVAAASSSSAAAWHETFAKSQCKLVSAMYLHMVCVRFLFLAGDRH